MGTDIATLTLKGRDYFTITETVKYEQGQKNKF